MIERILTKGDFVTTKWSGGETTQFLIYPENADFAKRDFLFRISSAAFTSTESKFTDFSGYQRYILPLKGEIYLHHEGLYSRELKEYDIEYFDGSWDTFSKNSADCRDYNFIIKNGSVAKMQILGKGDDYILKESRIITIFSMDDYTVNLGIRGNKYVKGFSLLNLKLDSKKEFNIVKSSSPIIITEFGI